MTSTSHSRHHFHHQGAATYVQFGSFQSPEVQLLHKQCIQDPQSPDMIRKEVTSSFDVKPLYPRPCFPKQAQVLPLASHGDSINMVQEHDRTNKGHFLQDRRPYQGEVFPSSSGSTVSAIDGSRAHPGDENFVYIHRQNSFIDVSQMTHHDHSHTVQNAERDPASRCRSRSNDEVDAAMTLATCLKTEN